MAPRSPPRAALRFGAPPTFFAPAVEPRRTRHEAYFVKAHCRGDIAIEVDLDVIAFGAEDFYGAALHLFDVARFVVGLAVGLMVGKLLGQRIRQCVGVAADHRIVATILDCVDLLRWSGERRRGNQAQPRENASCQIPMPSYRCLAFPSDLSRHTDATR